MPKSIQYYKYHDAELDTIYVSVVQVQGAIINIVIVNYKTEQCQSQCNCISRYVIQYVSTSSNVIINLVLFGGSLSALSQYNFLSLN